MFIEIGLCILGLFLVWFYRNTGSTSLPGSKYPINPIALKFVFDRNFQLQLVSFFNEQHRHAPTVYYNMLGRVIVSTIDVHLIEKVLTNREVFQASTQLREAILTLFGPSMFMSEGEEWVKKHRALQPLLNISMLKKNVEIVDNALRKFLQRINSHFKTADRNESAEVNIGLFVRMLFAEAIGEIAFGSNFEEEIYNYVSTRRKIDLTNPYAKGELMLEMAKTVVEGTGKRLISPTFLWKKTEDETIALNAFEHVFTQKVAEAKKEKEAHGNAPLDKEHVNLLSLLMEQSEELYPPKHILGECYSFFLAGHDTTATTLMFAIALLAQNPEVQIKLRDEMLELLKDRDMSNGLKLTFDDVSKMKYAHAVIKETMRMYPAAPSLPREVMRDIEIDGIELKKGTMFLANSCALQRLDTFYDNAAKFIPERWLNDANPSKANSVYTYLPFGTGARACFGQRLALIGIKAVLAYISIYYELETVPDKPLEEEAEFGLQPKGKNMWVKIKRRSINL